MNEPYFITGAQGCIGSWVVKALLERGDLPIVFDLDPDPRRLRQVLDGAQFGKVRFVAGDVTDGKAVREAFEASSARKIIHLAGLQVPFCKADPSLGARVNVVGTIHVFEAARALGAERVVYASSAAVYGADEDGKAVGENAPLAPATHYGVYKQANEGNARIYHLDQGIDSVGLRPLTVYGVNRDQGLTSDPTRAMKAAVLGRPFCIRFGGSTDFLYVADAAAAFIACADRAPAGAHVFNLHGETVSIARVIELIESHVPETHRGLVSCDGPPIPIASCLDDRAIQEALGELPSTPLEKGVKETMQRFRDLHARGRLDTRDLES